MVNRGISSVMYILLALALLSITLLILPLASQSSCKETHWLDQVVLWETALLRKPYGSLAEQLGASGPLFCAIMENYSSNIGLPMEDWPTPASEDGADGCANRGPGAVGLIGEDLRQLVEACLYLKHTKKTPRPTFESIASALAGMLQKLRHRVSSFCSCVRARLRACVSLGRLCHSELSQLLSG